VAGALRRGRDSRTAGVCAGSLAYLPTPSVHVTRHSCCRHVVRFRIERPTAFSICESLVLKVPARMW
jgi:hypothetical protein